MIRCEWANTNVDKIYQDYHDFEWGVPSFDDNYLFEMFVLESFHCGLSWYLILKKRENFRKAFDNFNPYIIANYDENKVNELYNNDGIIKNKLKINSTIKNAQAFLRVKAEFNSFSDYIWNFTNHQQVIEDYNPLINHNDLSDLISKDLKKRGFKFMKTITCFSYLQAIGVLNHHAQYCFKYHKENK